MNENYIGADEVGVGDYFGGIVTCAVYLDEKTTQAVQDLNIQDSKKLSNKTVILLALKLMKIVQYEKTVLLPSQYNDLFNKWKNAHVIKTYAHNLTICNLKNKLTFDCSVILDQYASSTNYEKYLKIIKPKQIAYINVFETKAESKYLAVAIASIIARYYFLKQITTLSKQYSVVLPLGFNNLLIHQTITKLTNKYGKEWFENNKVNLVKLHFKYKQ